MYFEITPTHPQLKLPPAHAGPTAITSYIYVYMYMAVSINWGSYLRVLIHSILG